MPNMSRKPFHETLRGLMEEHDLSVREVGRRTAKHGWGTYQTVSVLARGEMAPTIESMDAIAKAFQMDPRFFPEYRMAVIRRDLNPQKVGFRKALKNLEKYDGA